MFAVNVKLDCAHVLAMNEQDLDSFSENDLDAECSCQFQDCQQQETWICLTCKAILCSRYANAHMLIHSDEQKHFVALSFMDSSVWCFECNSYVDHLKLRGITERANQKPISALME
ncbi:NAD-dependent deacetylase sir2A-like [Convolutriloba macropyga]|uniref:NAD-dependent deacetylase sir2A-like n=1 Tax=Convolutriloba macropyga TaxID=536237 RepID=UPI003F51BCF7